MKLCMRPNRKIRIKHDHEGLGLMIYISARGEVTIRAKDKHEHDALKTTAVIEPRVQITK